MFETKFFNMLQRKISLFGGWWLLALMNLVLFGVLGIIHGVKVWICQRFSMRNVRVQ